jgi:putative glycosyltransferase (TIGR04348 family)
VQRLNIVIVTPALADANNGNWQTAQRWARILSSAYRVRLAAGWDGEGDEGSDAALLIALHARRSAAAVARWRARRPGAPLLLVLTGTDLYRDIAGDASAQGSLELADRLIVLNELGTRMLPEALRAKARVLLQSCASRQTLAKTGAHLRALMVGHLRPEKSPQTYFDAARLLAERADLRLDHAGAALDPALGEQALALMAEQPRYRWLGGLTHGQARRRIQQAHVLVHPSQMEGGAHVVTEAVRSGTPVLASRIDGNVGLLGADYEGYFAAGDAPALASQLRRLRDEPVRLARLQQQCLAREALFEPQRESAALHTLVAELLDLPRRRGATSHRCDS